MDLSRLQVSRARETEAYGQIDATPPDLDVVRRSGGSPTRNVVAGPSDVVRADARPAQIIIDDRSGAMVIEDEWCYDAHDAEIEDVFGNSWTTISIDGATGDIAAVATGNKLTSTTTDKFNSLIVGAQIRCFGFPLNEETAGSGYFDARVVSFTTGATPEAVLAEVTLVDETPSGSDAKIRSEYVRDGVTVYSNMFEWWFKSNATKNRWLINGAVGNSMQFSFEHPGRMRVSFDYSAKDLIGPSDSSYGSGTYNDYTQRLSMTSRLAFQAVLEGGVVLAPYVKSLSITFARPSDRVDDAGNTGPVGQGRDSWTVDLEMSVYNNVDGATLATKAGDETPTSLSFLTQDPDGNGVHFYIPAVLLTEGTPEGGGKSGRSMIPIKGMGYYNESAQLFLHQLCKLPASAA